MHPMIMYERQLMQVLRHLLTSSRVHQHQDLADHSSRPTLAGWSACISMVMCVTQSNHALCLSAWSFVLLYINTQMSR